MTGAVLPGSTVVAANITKDTPLQRAPHLKVALGGRYAYPPANGSELVASLDYTWTNKRSAIDFADLAKVRFRGNFPPPRRDHCSACSRCASAAFFWSCSPRAPDAKARRACWRT